MNIAYINRNLWDYDEVNRVPDFLSGLVDFIYITDSVHKGELALKLGWSKYIIYNIQVTNNSGRRQIIRDLTYQIEDVIPELQEYDKIFICDSNIIRHPSWYKEFFDMSDDSLCLYITKDYYKGERNTLGEEYKESLKLARWSEYSRNLKDCFCSYSELLNEMGINVSDIPVYSAKYIGWNLRHPMYKDMKKTLLEVGHKCFQGNILLSVIAKFYKEHTLHYSVKNNLGNGKLSRHKHIR